MHVDDNSYTGPALPRSLGTRLETALSLSERPETFGEYVDAMATLVESEGVDPDLETLCRTDQSPHRATCDGTTRQYHCPLDAVVVPVATAAVDHVEVETVDPVTGDAIAFSIGGSTVTATPSGAVLSFGVADDPAASPTGRPNPELAYRQTCPFAKAFGSRAAYDDWAADVDGHTIVLSIEDGLELARALGSAD